ncbi:MAG TPA: DinB family protein [Terracidiphilus sp.]|nr:DinB family protein [Terracidiphilus sp.]
MPQQVPTLKEFFLAQLDREAALTRKAIARVPQGQNEFKPHERSMALGYLAALVAGMLGWIALMIDRDELNMDDRANEMFRTKPLDSSAELNATLDKAVAAARGALESTTDAHLLRPWAFKMGGQVIDQQPRHIMIADGVFSHLAHHRGQLTVYLRLNEAKVPALYGPSADEHH